MESRFSHLAIIRWFTEALFPAYCVRCTAEGSVFCSSCKSVWWPTPIVISAKGPVETLFAVCPYKDRVMQSLIGQWKYQGVTAAKDELFGIVERAVRDYGDALPHVDAVAFVPLHARKRNQRGFDQAELLATHLAELLRVPVLPAIERTRFTEQQAQVDRADRHKTELISAFALRQGIVVPKRLLLVDDVWTTGNTMQAAAFVLRAARAEHVHAFTLAKG